MADRSKAVLQPPPRMTGTPAADLITIREWMHTFYNVAVLQSGLLDPAFQSNAGDPIDPENLPDPTQTTIARAQATANFAVERAIEAIAALPFFIAEFTLSGTNNQGTLAFGQALQDTNYRVVVQARDFSGSPPTGAFVVAKLDRTTSDFKVTVAAAPGAGNSVTYEALFFPI